MASASVEQRPLVPEVPVKRRLLNPNRSVPQFASPSPLRRPCPIQWRHGSLYSAKLCHVYHFITDKHNMSTNLSVIKNLRCSIGPSGVLVRGCDVKPNRPLIVILSTVALRRCRIGLIMPVLPASRAIWFNSNDVTAHYGILLALYALM